MKLKLDKKNRKYIEIEIENDENTTTLKYYEKNTKQIKEIKKLIKNEEHSKIDELTQKQFMENLKGDKETIKELVDFYDENGNFFEFMNECDLELGKQFKKD